LKQYASLKQTPPSSGHLIVVNVIPYLKYL
jgi:hypothetical protein